MEFRPDMENLFGMAHGGRLFALIDVGLRDCVNFTRDPRSGARLNVTYVAAPQSLEYA